MGLFGPAYFAFEGSLLCSSAYYAHLQSQADVSRATVSEC